MEVFKVINAESEAGLVARIMAGDGGAEEHLAERYRRGVLIIITKSCGDSNLAQDLCQDTFVRALQAIRQGQLREPEKLPAFIWSLAHNLVIEHFRKSRKDQRPIIGDEQLADSALNPFDLLLQKERADIIRQAISEVESDKYRKMLFRFYIAEEDKGKICKELGISSRQFNVTLFRARKRLYEKLRGKL